MLTAELIQKMKRNNISKDKEKTTERAKEIFKSATKDQKIEMETLAGVKRVSFERVYSTGSISAKLAVAMAKVMDVDPLYLTGEADERGDGAESKLLSFMESKGYKDLSKKASRPARKPRAKAKEPEEITYITAEDDSDDDGESLFKDMFDEYDDEEDDEDDDFLIGPITPYSKMTEDEAGLLLHALFIQAKYSAEACAVLNFIKASLANKCFPDMDSDDDEGDSGADDGENGDGDGDGYN